MQFQSDMKKKFFTFFSYVAKFIFVEKNIRDHPKQMEK